jgi:hypothetical protein
MNREKNLFSYCIEYEKEPFRVSYLKNPKPVLCNSFVKMPHAAAIVILQFSRAAVFVPPLFCGRENDL